MKASLHRSVLLVAMLQILACTKRDKPEPVTRGVATGGSPHGLCESFATPRVETFGERVFFAIGYDLANTVMIRTSEGNVVIDAGISPEAARRTKAALLEKSPGPIRALIYTHSHMDHVGGASVWVEPGTEIWASASFVEQFFKQYGLFQPLEQIRGTRQYGLHLGSTVLPCTAIGPVPDLAAAMHSGARMPTKTFSVKTDLTIGGVKLELIEAHGETQDHLMVWLPDERVVVSGDNIYRAFPNLYTIRGTSPRPVDKWIESLDRLRRLAPVTVLPGHTEAIQGEATVRETVTAYRDAIQWVRDATVRGANLGESPEVIAESARLPEHLAKTPYLRETYGQVDWSSRAIYSNEVGWFSGEPEELYPLPRAERERREIELMGGERKVLRAAKKALADGDARWAVSLLAKLRNAGGSEKAKAEMANALEVLAGQLKNTNGKAYLAQSAVELKVGETERLAPDPDEGFVRIIPPEIVFRRMAVALNPEMAIDANESLRFEFTDLGAIYTITVRRGVAEIVQGEALPGTPEPVATVRVDSFTWKRLAMKQLSLPEALAAGDLKVDGAWLATANFLRRFRVE